MSRDGKRRKGTNENRKQTERKRKSKEKLTTIGGGDEGEEGKRR